MTLRLQALYGRYLRVSLIRWPRVQIGRVVTCRPGLILLPLFRVVPRGVTKEVRHGHSAGTQVVSRDLVRRLLIIDLVTCPWFCLRRVRLVTLLFRMLRRAKVTFLPLNKRATFIVLGVDSRGVSLGNRKDR